MGLPAPVPGLVIRYSYLWLEEHRQGREEGVKDRPCAIVLASAETNEGQTVLGCPLHIRSRETRTMRSKFPLARKCGLGLMKRHPGLC